MHQLSTSWIPVENSLSGVDPCINFQPVGYRLKTTFQQALIHASTFNQLDTG